MYMYSETWIIWTLIVDAYVNKQPQFFERFFLGPASLDNRCCTILYMMYGDEDWGYVLCSACMGGNVWQGGYLRDMPFTCRVTKQLVHGYMDLKYGLFIHALCNYLVEYVGVSSEKRAVYWVMREEIKVGYIQLKFQGRMRFSHILYMYTCVVPKQVSFHQDSSFEGKVELYYFQLVYTPVST